MAILASLIGGVLATMWPSLFRCCHVLALTFHSLTRFLALTLMFEQQIIPSESVYKACIELENE
jgi:hypothetical protein